MLIPLMIENLKMKWILKILLFKKQDMDIFGFRLVLRQIKVIIIKNTTNITKLIKDTVMRLLMEIEMMIKNLKMREIMMMISSKTLDLPLDQAG